MADARLRSLLEVVAQRLARVRSLKFATVGWVVLALILAVLFSLKVSSTALISTFLLGLLSVLVLQLAFREVRERDRLRAIGLIEQNFPDLDSRLLTALQQWPDDQWRFSYLQSEVISEVFQHGQRHDWGQSVPSGVLNRYRFSSVLTGLGCLVLALVLWNQTQPQTVAAKPHKSTIDKRITREAEFEISVEPGDAAVERGTSLLVTARFPKRLPGDVRLIAVDSKQQRFQIPLSKSLDDPLFGGRIPNVEHDLTYHIEFDEQKSDAFDVTTFEYPKLVKADAKIDFPEYTKLEQEVIPDTRRVSLVEGSLMTLDCELNKDVSEAFLIDEDGKRQPLDRVESDGYTFRIAMTPGQADAQTYRLQLRDADGRQNREPPEFVVQVRPNKPPHLKITFPSKDLRVSPLQEVSIQGEASDDFGLVECGLVYQVPNGDEETLQLGEAIERDVVHRMDHLIRLEKIDAKPDDLVSYYFYADDIGPDGQVRRSYSDIFFAEVRPFDEIFRQMPSQRSQSQQQGGQSQKLLELQRNIVSGTWNLMRKNPKDPVTPKFGEDLKTLIESQGQAKELTMLFQQDTDDVLLKQHAQEAIDFMSAAEVEFNFALDGNTSLSLGDGRGAAQEAYQKLLKLQSREKRVQNSQSQGQGSQSQKRMDRQLAALELKNDQDRYETERQAQQEMDQQNRENLQVLNRLRELARRQEDLNDKIRDLENALRNAKTLEEQQELERQLKRLQEEQEELLRNLDELNERMNNDQNRQEMAEARDQVEKTRERVVRSSDALKEGQTARALTEGTRAQRELEDLKEEFRKKSAGQFDDAIRNLRKDVRELAETEKELSDAINQQLKPEEKKQGRPSLRDTDNSTDREALAEQFNEQKGRLQNALDQTRQIVEEAEQTEPLLAKKLYEAVRDLREHQPEEALESGAQLSKYGLLKEAQELEKKAGQGIDRLAKGVEEAATSILGDENKALAQASSELDNLKKAIEAELSQGDPKFKPEPRQQPNGQQQNGQQQNGQQQNGQQQNGQQQNGQQQNGQQQNGQQQNGQQQNGQQPNGQQQNGQQQNGQQQNGQQPNGQQPNGQQQNGQQQNGQQQNGQQQNGQQQNGQQPNGQQQSGGGLAQQLNPYSGGGEDGGGTASAAPMMPLTGGDFRDWSDRMRDVEEMLSEPELRAQAATIRDRARQMRIDVKRHSKQPEWSLVRTSIYGPLLELQDLVDEELRRRKPQRETLVPIDRDPVPDQYADFVEEYYKELARQRNGAE